jgi:hypothetical protein
MAQPSLTQDHPREDTSNTAEVTAGGNAIACSGHTPISCNRVYFRPQVEHTFPAEQFREISWITSDILDAIRDRC